MLRRWMLMTAVAAGFGLAGYQEVHAGGYTVYIINMAKLNYKTPVSYNNVVRSGLARDVYTTSSACLQSISTRVRDNKRYGTDWECYLIVYTDKYPTTPPRTEIGRLSHVAAGSFGKWAGWIIYWVPARNKGYRLNPYKNFKAYGASARSATPGRESNTITAPPAPTGTEPASSRNTLGDYHSPAFDRARLAAWIASSEFRPRGAQPAFSFLDRRAIVRHAGLPRSIPCVPSPGVSNRC